MRRFKGIDTAGRKKDGGNGVKTVSVIVRGAFPYWES